MKNVYLLSFKKKQLLITALFTIFVLASNAQNLNPTSCSNATAGTCQGGNVSQDFNTSNGGFIPSAGGFAWTGPAADGDYTVASTDRDVTYTLTSADYILGTPGAAPSVGFSLAGTTAIINNNNGLTVQILNSSDVIIAQCTNVTVGAGGQVCININDLDLVQGATVRFRIVITTSNASGNTGAVLKFDDFADGPTNAIVPVRLTNFSASKDNNKVKLFWKVDAESKLSGYEVERSSNGANFQKIGFVNATGASNYNFTDFAPLAGVNFYRLRSIDNDSKFIYSFVVSVNGRQGLFINKFPNPAIKNLTVQHPQASGTAMLRITSLDGKLVKQLRLPLNAVQTVVDVSGLLAGNYVVEFINGADRVNSSFVKQ